MFNLLYKSLMSFKKYWRKYFFFVFMYMLFSSYVLIPFFGFFLNRLLLILGNGVVLNSNAYKIFLDLKGVIGLTIMFGIAVIFIFIEIGTLIIIAHKHSINKEIWVTEALMTSLTNIKSIVGFGIINLSLIVFLLVPLINIPYEPEILKRIKLPLIFWENVSNSIIGIIVYWAIAIILFYILIRCIFTLHELIIEKKSITRALIESIKLTKTISFSLIVELIFLNAVLLIVGFFLFMVLSNIPIIINVKINALLKNLLVTTSSLLTLTYTLLIMPINIIFLTELYNQAKLKESTYKNIEIKTFKIKLLEKIESTFDKIFLENKLVLILAIIFVILTSTFTGFLVNRTTMHAGRNVLAISHRGKVYDEFENSINAIQASIDAEVDGIEIDIQRTKDGVLVLHHDRNLIRTFGINQNIEDLTYEEIKKIEAKNFEIVKKYGQIIPTLEQALELIHKEMTIILDVKTSDGNQQLAKNLSRLINKTTTADHLIVQSFNRDFLTRIKNINPKIKVSQIMYYALGNLSNLDADYYTIHKGMLSVDFVKKARMLDRGIFVWAVNNEEDMREALNYDIDGIITNQPIVVKDVLGRAVKN